MTRISAAGVGDPAAAGGPAEPAEHLGVDHAEAGAGQHRDRQLRDHRHVQRDPVAGLQAAEVPQQRGQLVDLAVQLLVGDDLVASVSGSGTQIKRRLVRSCGQVPVDAVVAGVEPAADEPLPEGRVAGVQRGVPVLVPAPAGRRIP